MTSGAEARGNRRFLRWGLWLAVAAALVFLGASYAGIVRQSQVDEAQRADAIVVFGAAQYSGRPSPVFKARLDHGLELFQRGLAPVVITTGGQGGDPQFSEGGVGRDYLVARGLADRDIIAETQSDDTRESVERVAAIMKTNGMRSCVAVSDGYHLYRIKKMLEREGLRVHTSPRPSSKPASRWQRGWSALRETLSYALWRLRLT